MDPARIAMISVASLLNPLPSPSEHERDAVTPKSSHHRSMTPSSTSSTFAKHTMLKTDIVHMKTEPNGEVKFKPCEIQDDTIAAEHQKFHVEPVGRISDYPRHIPYSSDKKSFQRKTGRDSIEGTRCGNPSQVKCSHCAAYHYTFRMPGDDPQKDAHAIMWDYNVGLVRITALFKSLKHSKVSTFPNPWMIPVDLQQRRCQPKS